MFRPYLPLAVGVCLALLPVEHAQLLVIPELPGALARLAGLSPAPTYAAAAIVGSLLDATLLLVLVRYWERRRWDSVGVKMISPRDVLIAYVVWLIELRAMRLTGRMVRWHIPLLGDPPPPSFSLALVGDPFNFARIATSAAAQELGTRAYIIERFRALSGSIWIAGAVSLLASVILHVPGWGLQGAVARAPIQLVLVLLYLWRRNLPLCVLVHVLVNTHHSIVMSLLKLPEPIRGWVLYPIGFILRL
jgi:membrane protease YdiL (CAAX protease family)